MPDALDVTTLFSEITSLLRTTEHAPAPLRALRREQSRRIRDADVRSVVRLAIELHANAGVHRFFSDELIANHRGAMAALTLADITKLGRGMDSWDKVDCFGTILAGPAWRIGCIDDAVVEKWARSKDRWWRRAALVCTTKLNVKGASDDAKRTLAVCDADRRPR